MFLRFNVFLLFILLSIPLIYTLDINNCNKILDVNDNNPLYKMTLYMCIDYTHDNSNAVQQQTQSVILHKRNRPNFCNNQLGYL